MSFNQEPNRKLQSFVRRYQPQPPAPSPHLEMALMDQIQRSPQRANTVGHHPAWPKLGGALALLAIVVGSGLTWRQQWQTAQTHEDQILEAFLWETWVGTTGDGELWEEFAPLEMAGGPGQER